MQERTMFEPVIETERLWLRQFTLADLEDHYRQITGDAEVMKTLPSAKPIPKERAEALLRRFIDHWERHGFGLWAMIHKQDHQLIGHCGLQFLENTPEVELAYAIAQPYWNQGLTTEAAKASVRYAFETLNRQRLVAITSPTNFASQSVMKNAGLRYEKIAYYYNLEVVYFSLERQEYEAQRLAAVGP